VNTDELDRITELGRAWMRASLAERPADPDQQRRIRILLTPRREAS
jgi:hypothetical protein